MSHPPRLSIASASLNTDSTCLITTLVRLSTTPTKYQLRGHLTQDEYDPYRMKFIFIMVQKPKKVFGAVELSI